MELVIASGNAGKVREFGALLADLPLQTRAQPEGLEVEETGSSFAANARLKAEAVARATGCWALADDSGLEVDALGGAPGVHSARFAALDSGGAGNSPDADNNAKLLRLLAGVSQASRTARFRCVLALVEVRRPAPPWTPQLFEGACEGWIDLAPHGAGGFGYDPLFIPLGHEQSFAELGEGVKNGLSHRAKALARLRAWFNSRP